MSKCRLIQTSIYQQWKRCTPLRTRQIVGYTLRRKYPMSDQLYNRSDIWKRSLVYNEPVVYLNYKTFMNMILLNMLRFVTFQTKVGQLPCENQIHLNESIKWNPKSLLSYLNRSVTLW